MRRVLSLEIGIEKPYFKPGAALRETKNVPRVLILQEALYIDFSMALAATLWLAFGSDQTNTNPDLL
jgi:hypothetical protein